MDIFNFDPSYVIFSMVFCIVGFTIVSVTKQLSNIVPENVGLSVSVTAMREEELVEFLNSNKNASNKEVKQALNRLKMFNMTLYHKYNLLLNGRGAE